MTATLSAGVTAFAGELRREHGFALGPGETHDALRALDSLGIGDRTRVRTALRCVFCAKHDELAVFDRAFDAFFSGEPTGVPQRRMREIGDGPRAHDAVSGNATGTAWELMSVRYSPSPGAPRVPTIPRAGFERAFDDAGRLIARLRVGRSRKWRPQPRGRRIDVRRTLRATLRNAGEPLELRLLGHPRRDPRFVVLIDGSRSMSEHAEGALQFALALCRRTRRARVFTFSTELHEITRDLRETRGKMVTLDPIGEAWGGGTRIGASLRAFLRRFGGTVDDRAYVMVFSDGLDTGDVPLLQRAMRELDRRSAGVVWVNPHAGSPGFAPSAAAMRAALPYVAAVVAPEGVRDLA
jgi:uncharacterized protein with von Willebrand factor type A (vWA) domain